MNGAHWHLVVNHLPIVFPIVGLLVLCAGYSVKSEVVKRTSFMIFALGAVTTALAMATGDGAEEVAEHFVGVTRNSIHNHEEIAETFALISYLLGALSLFGLWANLKQKTYASYITIGIGVLALVTLFFAKQTGTSGGTIRHPEISTETPVSKAVNESDDESE